MFKWLTRKDGARIDRAKRRLKSPRGSVFTEFALIVPIVVLVCSALIEIVGFWDAQIMANHSAWTVGRIVMVRGSDGLAFSSKLDEKSKTGIAGSSMPEALKEALADLDKYISGANKFNNRGNIATLFLMSTCGIGYFGKSPGESLRDIFKDLCTAGVKAITEGIPDWIAGAISDIKIPLLDGGGNFLEEFVQKLLNELLNEVVSAVLKPLTEALKSLLTAAFNRIMDWLDIDHFFDGTGDAAYIARHLYGAASRIARAKDKAGQDVLTVTDMGEAHSNAYVFAEAGSFKKLAYPQCVDKDAKSDGYFVSNPSGWPPDDDVLGLVHIEINWPYESGWLFPVVSGYGSVSKPPVARGHSMVFQQPYISNENLYSEGAKGFDPGSYTNTPRTKAMEDLADEMKDYLKCVLFCMKYRISEDKLTLEDEGDWYVSWTWKRCKELKEIFKCNPGYSGGDYAKCWSAITGHDQDALLDTLKPFFEESSYRSREYFYWDGAWHSRYGGALCSPPYGNAGLYNWYQAWNNSALNYRDASFNMFSMSLVSFMLVHNAYKKQLTEKCKPAADPEWLFKKITSFSSAMNVNVANIVKWQVGHDYDAWVKQDAQIHQCSKVADRMFAKILELLHREIVEIGNIIDGTAQYTGDPDDPVLEPEDEAVAKDPEKAAAKAREKWNKMKDNLRKKLAEVDEAAKKTREEWTRYSSMVNSFRKKRTSCVSEYFAAACCNTLIVTGDATTFDSANYSRFRLPADVMPYDIGKGTRQMLKEVITFTTNVVESYTKEVEYGAMLGLESAGKAKREGKSPETIIDEEGTGDHDTPGSVSPGSDENPIINEDHQTYEGGKWKWK